jgi:hypothetical protein
MAFWAFAYNVVLDRIGGDDSPDGGSNGVPGVATVPA